MSDEPGPLVSVITAVLNGKHQISRCIESVRAQDYQNIEHIVYDGNSSDGTVELLRQYDDRIDLWRSESDKGVYDAWNKALADVRGDWICFLGSDDEFLPGAVSSYMALAAEFSRAEYLSSEVKWVHPSGYQRIYGAAWNWGKFAKFMCTAHVGSMHRRTLFERLGKFDISYRTAADYEFLLRAGCELNSAYMPVLTVVMRAGGISDSLKALDEQARAKILTGGRSKLIAAFERHIARTKFFIRPLRAALHMDTVREE
jgi:glycosyltransferase involved in cell wall biosynthesis